MEKIFSFFFLICSGVSLFGLIYQYDVSNRLVSTVGEMVSARIDYSRSKPMRRGNGWQVVVEYNYNVSGQTIKGNQLSLNGNRFILKSSAERAVMSLRSSKKVLIWYDPKRPTFSVLEPDIGIYGVGLFVCLLLYFVSKKYMKNWLIFIFQKTGRC